MKNVTYKKRELINRGRVISIREQKSDKECVTRVMKNFIYLISRADAMPSKVAVPQIRITKMIDNETKTEVLLFKVRGTIFVKEKRFIYQVAYMHSLSVRIYWKNHVLSSKPAALA